MRAYAVTLNQEAVEKPIVLELFTKRSDAYTYYEAHCAKHKADSYGRYDSINGESIISIMAVEVYI
jgi:hypothetical protein